MKIERDNKIKQFNSNLDREILFKTKQKKNENSSIHKIHL